MTAPGLGAALATLRAAALDRGLTEFELRTLVAILAHAGPDGTAWPSLTKLAARFGCDAALTRRRVRKLEAAGYLTTERRMGHRGGDTASVYRPGRARDRDTPPDAQDGPAPSDAQDGPAPSDAQDGPAPPDAQDGPAKEGATGRCRMKEHTPAPPSARARQYLSALVAEAGEAGVPLGAVVDALGLDPTDEAAAAAVSRGALPPMGGRDVSLAIERVKRLKERQGATAAPFFLALAAQQEQALREDFDSSLENVSGLAGDRQSPPTAAVAGQVGPRDRLARRARLVWRNLGAGEISRRVAAMSDGEAASWESLSIDELDEQLRAWWSMNRSRLEAAA